MHATNFALFSLLPYKATILAGMFTCAFFHGIKVIPLSCGTPVTQQNKNNPWLGNGVQC